MQVEDMAETNEDKPLLNQTADRRADYLSQHAVAQNDEAASFTSAIEHARQGNHAALQFLKRAAWKGDRVAFDTLVECAQPSERVTLAVEYSLNGNNAALVSLLKQAQIGDRTAFAFLQGRLREGNRLVLSFLVAQAQEHDQVA